MSQQMGKPTEVPQSPQPPQKPAGYEFTIAQNNTIEGLASRMKIIGVLYLVVGGVLTLAGIWTLTQSLIQGLVSLVQVVFFGFMGYWTVQAAASFKLIVQTRGNDISYLMTALEDLRKIYNLQVWLLLVVLALLAIGVLLAVFMMA